MSETMEQTLGRMQIAVNAACDEMDKLRREKKALREALQALYDAMPTGYGEDRALNEALAAAEKALGIGKEKP